MTENDDRDKETTAAVSSSENIEEDGGDVGLESVKVVQLSTENVSNDLTQLQTSEEPNSEMRTEDNRNIMS